MLLKFISDVGKERVDTWLAGKISDISRTFIKKISEDGGLKINGKPAKSREKLKVGDTVEILVPQAQALDVVAQDIYLEVLHEDNDIIVINKPKGMVVHPAAGNHDGTLVNALLGRYGDSLSGINGVIRPGIVHRIDKDTTGVLVVARNNSAHEKLSNLFKEHDIKRVYIALVEGVLPVDHGSIDAPMGRHPVERKKMAVNTKNGRRAVTHFNVIRRFKDATLVEVTLETGRTHQIRVHFSHIGHTVVGDLVYGRKKRFANIEGQLLHAKILGFAHPASGKYVEFSANLPDEFQNFLNTLG